MLCSLLSTAAKNIRTAMYAVLQLVYWTHSGSIWKNMVKISSYNRVEKN